MVHQYKNNGYNIVLDVNSGAIHVVDDVTYDVIEMFENNSPEEIKNTLAGKYPAEEIDEAIEEVNELKDNEELFTEDEPIATFGGTFEGNGHTISGLILSDSFSPAGLFSTVQGSGVIRAPGKRLPWL